MTKKNIKIKKKDAESLNSVLSLIRKVNDDVQYKIKVLEILNINAGAYMKILVQKYNVPKGEYKLEGETLKLINAHPTQPTD